MSDPQPTAPCERCQSRGMIENHRDKQGNFLGHDRWDPTYSGVLITGPDSEYKADLVASSDVYPCPACRPKQFLRWKDGHLRGSHRCQECDDIKRGRYDKHEA